MGMLRQRRRNWTDIKEKQVNKGLKCEKRIKKANIIPGDGHRCSDQRSVANSSAYRHEEMMNS